jgi:hypothetical protein
MNNPIGTKYKIIIKTITEIRMIIIDKPVNASIIFSFINQMQDINSISLLQLLEFDKLLDASS